MRGHYDSNPPRSLLGSTLGVVAVALGIGFIGAIALDYHSHECDRCKTRWSHLGAFNGGDERAHMCPACGSTQWWKRGASRASDSELRAPQAPLGHAIETSPNTIGAPPQRALPEGAPA